MANPEQHEQGGQAAVGGRLQGAQPRSEFGREPDQGISQHRDGQVLCQVRSLVERPAVCCPLLPVFLAHAAQAMPLVC